MAVIPHIERFGTQGADTYVQPAGTRATVAYYGLGGNDRIIYPDSGFLGNFGFAIGGPGADTYELRGSGFYFIADYGYGPGDRLISPGFSPSAITTIGFDIEDKHLFAIDTVTAQFLFIPYWKTPANRIETFDLAGRSYTFNQIERIVAQEAYKVTFRDLATGNHPLAAGLAPLPNADRADAQLWPNTVAHIEGRLKALGQPFPDWTAGASPVQPTPPPASTLPPPPPPPPPPEIPPVARTDQFVVNAAEMGKKGVALDILVNDTPSSGNLNLKSAQIVDAPDNGTAAIKKGALLYKPDPGFEGTDTLTYTVADASGRASNPAEVRIEVRQPNPPAAADDRFTLNAAELGKKGAVLDILVNDTPFTGALNLKSARIVNAPDNGTASIKKGTLLYKPDPGFEGTDTLTYTVADASGRASNPAEVRIEVRQPAPPRAGDDQFTLEASAIGKKGAVLDILENDRPNTGPLNLKSVQIVDGPDNGSVSVKKGTLLYKPDPGFAGTDTLTYTVADGSGRASNPAEVRIDVRQPDASSPGLPPPPPPLPPGPSGPLAAGESPGPLLTPAGSAASAPLTLADLLESDDAIGTAGAATAAPDTPTVAAPPPGPTLDTLIATTDDPAALA